ncbi:unnamed protein product [Rotaria sp. Silwood1]|nr:unnamed protein product [Rotaria sp. Silwood1]CAF4862010.1 unnamed protein product [Rotaria sp. Silwood1]
MPQAIPTKNKTTDNLSLDHLSIKTNDDDNKESTTLIWFDPNIGSREDTEKTKEQLRLINDYVVFSTDLEQCATFIESVDKEKVFLITSGSKASQILSRTSSCRQLDSIFIFCLKKERYEHLFNEYSKIVGIYVKLDDLCQSIEEQIDLVNRHMQTFSFFDQHEKALKDLSEESAAFLWFQLFNYVVARLPRNQQAKQQMIQICKDYYRGNKKEIRAIEDFEKTYRSEDSILWYSKQTFVYKLINKALRTEDINLLYIFRFFIGDLSEALQQEHTKILSSKHKILNVYRGVKLDKEEFDKLKENQGKLVSTNGYLSTSQRKSLALSFAMKPTKRIDVIPVLFHIQCDIKQVNKNIIFADISEFSQYPHEEEVLFDLNACFIIESIEEQESLQIITMNLSNEGQKITKDYLDLTRQETEELSVSIVFGRLLCNLGEYDKSQKYFEQLLNDSKDEDRAWIEFNIGRTLDFKGEWKRARKYFERAYDRMMKSEPARIIDSAHVLNYLGNILSYQRKYDEALDYHQRALKIREEFHPSGHVDIATSLSNIGRILHHQGQHDEALDYHQQALKIREKFYPSGHVDIARSLNNIGRILHDQKKYDEALNYHQRALKIYKEFLPFGHIHIARSLNNIGRVLDSQGKYDEALDYHQRALKIREKFYPSGHVEVAKSLSHIGRILQDQGKYDEALDYHQRALKLQEKFYPSDHIAIAFGLNNIGACHENQNKPNIALDYYQRALAMYEKLLPVGHSDRQKTEMNIRRLAGKN